MPSLKIFLFLVGSVPVPFHQLRVIRLSSSLGLHLLHSNEARKYIATDLQIHQLVARLFGPNGNCWKTKGTR
ncbi:hypothetical protein EV424DRAFT_917243 [Suillus variegatus]|nr:hypothetical protein EV424DRAFT_917243 [Suillus variegatus]